MSLKLVKSFLTHSILLLLLVLQGVNASLPSNNYFPPAYHLQNPLGALQIESLTIFTMFQDHQGFIWLGTSAGVLRYDGYEFKSTSKDFEQLEVWSIIQDNNKDLWFGTRNKGLVKLTSSNQKITLFQHDKNNSHSLSHNNIRKLLLSKQGGIYIATSGGGLNKYNTESNNFQRIPLINPQNTAILYLRDLVESNTGDLWIATRDYGVIQLNKRTSKLTYYQTSAKDSNTLSSNTIKSLSFDDSNHKLWVGTWGGGLNLLDINTGKVRRFYLGSGDKKNVGPQTIVTMMRDRQNMLWLGTLNGVAYFDLTTEKFHYLKDEYPELSTLGHAAYYALMCDEHGSIWLGSWRGKLHSLVLDDHNFHLESLTQYFPGSIHEKSISSILTDNNGDVWLGTETSGVLHLSANLQLIKHFQHQKSDGNSLSDNAISTIKQQSNGDIWVGTRNGGLNKYQKESDDFITFTLLNKDGGRGSSDYISEIFEYNDKLFIGSTSGLYEFNSQKNEMKHIDLVGNENIYPSNGSVNAMFLDSRFKLWLVTTEGVYLKKTDMPFELVFSFNEQLPASSVRFSTVAKIAEDDQHNIWFATNTGLWEVEEITKNINGNTVLVLQQHLSTILSGMQKDSAGMLWLASNNNLYRFSPLTYQFDTFSILDGIKGSFNNAAHGLAINNQLYFGSDYGLLSFDPQYIVTKNHQIKVTIDDLLLANKSVQVDEKSRILTKPIYQTQHLTLPDNENIISFDISALDFRQPNKVIYQHRLLGFDEAWIENTAKNRRITYTNLNPGQYTLSIRGAHTFNPIWGESTDLSITILPPLWWTWWAKLIYVLVALLLLKVSYHVHKHRILFIAYEQAALTDSLTGLKNRRFLESTIDQDISQSMRLKKDNTLNADVTFFFADIDFFKEVNDKYGHESGDMVLKQFSALLQDVFRSSDHIIRWGGEEFLIVSRFTQADKAQEMAERLRTKVGNKSFEISTGEKITKTVSIGYTTIPFDRAATCRLSCSQLIEVADKALYHVKDNGRDGWAGISAGEHFNLRNFERIGDFNLADKVSSGEIILVSKLPHSS
ncbi:MAG: diguanylate cyclase [Colwellia sp.]|uniref:ligand-binding sensor domain-containing diguanylate cyclase n=1 Tax=Colwellia sp. TaxID=56799 RepID=UPI001D24ACB6|nr:ligand-binding sensor domain-containing diguanylate cyclase [Colwellia sp.]NQY49439.1 diguanylate cyclase [Colwellia sp.]